MIYLPTIILIKVLLVTVPVLLTVAFVMIAVIKNRKKSIIYNNKLPINYFETSFSLVPNYKIKISLKDRTINTLNMSKVFIIFIMGFISRVLVKQTLAVDVFQEYTGVVSILYYIFMSLFIVLVHELIMYFEFSIIPSFILDFIKSIFSYTVKSITFSFSCLVNFIVDIFRSIPKVSVEALKPSSIRKAVSSFISGINKHENKMTMAGSEHNINKHKSLSRAKGANSGNVKGYNILKMNNAGNPGGNPGANPGGNPGANPGGNPGANPGGNPGANPGGNPGANPGPANPELYPFARENAAYRLVYPAGSSTIPANAFYNPVGGNQPHATRLADKLDLMSTTSARMGWNYNSLSVEEMSFMINYIEDKHPKSAARLKTQNYLLNGIYNSKDRRRMLRTLP